MSLYDYRESLEIGRNGYQFYALIMAAMRQADTDNLSRLQAAFPWIHAELKERMNAPEGMLLEDYPRPLGVPVDEENS